MQLRYNYRVYPTPRQREALARAFGCARVVFNDGLRARQEAREQGLPYISDGELSKQVITQAKQSPERGWLSEVSAVALQQALADLNVAYRNFFASVTGKRKGRRVAPPRFRSRKQRGSNNRRRAVVKVARAHARVADTRRDWQHKLSTRIIRDNQAVYVEDLCVVRLGRTRLATSVHDAGWASFVGMLQYKAARYGRAFGKIDRFAPTSQTCSACGRLDGPKPLNIRSWTCPCGAVHDRDVNAALNVLAQGRWESLNACGAQVRPAPLPAPRRETGIHPGAARCSTRSAEGIPVL